MSTKKRLAAAAKQEPKPSRSRPRRANGRDGKEEERQESTATELVKLAEAAGVELFHTPGGDPEGYATIPIDGHRETWKIGNKAFRLWLGRLYWEAKQSAANSQATQDAINILRGKALFDGPEYPVAVRLAEIDGAIWLDLANETWQAVRITAADWQVVDNPPVRFTRPRGMLPLPVPEREGMLGNLRSFINVGSDDDWLLLVAWLTAALNPSGPFPVLGVNGEQGSAKSTTCRMLRELIDPNESPVRSAPRDERDLAIAAANGWVIALDNLSSISPSLSDALCRLATGGGFSTRELFSDGEEKLFNAKRPVMVNGINELAERSDLLDRTIAITLPAIPDDLRLDENRELWPKFRRAKPYILGGLLDMVSTALANVDAVILPGKPRMADFAIWASAAMPALNIDADQFLSAYAGNRATANESAIESSLIAEPLLGLMNDRDEWQGTATALLGELENRAAPRIVKQKGWPKRANVLSGELTRIAPNLRRMGIDVESGKSAGRRYIAIRTTAQNSVQTVQCAPHSANGESVASPHRPAASEPEAESPDDNGPVDAVDARDDDLGDCSDEYDHLMDDATWE